MEKQKSETSEKREQEGPLTEQQKQRRKREKRKQQKHKKRDEKSRQKRQDKSLEKKDSVKEESQQEKEAMTPSPEKQKQIPHQEEANVPKPHKKKKKKKTHHDSQSKSSNQEQSQQPTQQKEGEKHDPAEEQIPLLKETAEQKKEATEQATQKKKEDQKIEEVAEHKVEDDRPPPRKYRPNAKEKLQLLINLVKQNQKGKKKTDKKGKQKVELIDEQEKKQKVKLEDSTDQKKEEIKQVIEGMKQVIQSSTKKQEQSQKAKNCEQQEAKQPELQISKIVDGPEQNNQVSQPDQKIEANQPVQEDVKELKEPVQEDGKEPLENKETVTQEKEVRELQQPESIDPKTELAKTQKQQEVKQPEQQGKPAEENKAIDPEPQKIEQFNQPEQQMKQAEQQEPEKSKQYVEVEPIKETEVKQLEEPIIEPVQQVEPQKDHGAQQKEPQLEPQKQKEYEDGHPETVKEDEKQELQKNIQPQSAEPQEEGTKEQAKEHEQPQIVKQSDEQEINKSIQPEHEVLNTPEQHEETKEAESQEPEGNTANEPEQLQQNKSKIQESSEVAPQTDKETKQIKQVLSEDTTHQINPTDVFTQQQAPEERGQQQSNSSSQVNQSSQFFSIVNSNQEEISLNFNQSSIPTQPTRTPRMQQTYSLPEHHHQLNIQPNLTDSSFPESDSVVFSEQGSVPHASDVESLPLQVPLKETQSLLLSNTQQEQVVISKILTHSQPIDLQLQQPEEEQQNLHSFVENVELTTTEVMINQPEEEQQPTIKEKIKKDKEEKQKEQEEVQDSGVIEQVKQELQETERPATNVKGMHKTDSDLVQEQQPQEVENPKQTTEQNEEEENKSALENRSTLINQLTQLDSNHSSSIKKDQGDKKEQKQDITYFEVEKRGTLINQLAMLQSQQQQPATKQEEESKPEKHSFEVQKRNTLIDSLTVFDSQHQEKKEKDDVDLSVKQSEVEGQEHQFQQTQGQGETRQKRKLSSSKLKVEITSPRPQQQEQAEQPHSPYPYDALDNPHKVQKFTSFQAQTLQIEVPQPEQAKEQTNDLVLSPFSKEVSSSAIKKSKIAEAEPVKITKIITPVSNRICLPPVHQFPIVHSHFDVEQHKQGSTHCAEPLSIEYNLPSQEHEVIVDGQQVLTQIASPQRVEKEVVEATPSPSNPLKIPIQTFPITQKVQLLDEPLYRQHRFQLNGFPALTCRPLSNEKLQQNSTDQNIEDYSQQIQILKNLDVKPVKKEITVDLTKITSNETRMPIDARPAPYQTPKFSINQPIHYQTQRIPINPPAHIQRPAPHQNYERIVVPSRQVNFIHNVEMARSNIVREEHKPQQEQPLMVEKKFAPVTHMTYQEVSPVSPKFHINYNDNNNRSREKQYQSRVVPQPIPQTVSIQKQSRVISNYHPQQQSPPQQHYHHPYRQVHNPQPQVHHFQQIPQPLPQRRVVVEKPMRSPYKTKMSVVSPNNIKIVQVNINKNDRSFSNNSRTEPIRLRSKKRQQNGTPSRKIDTPNHDKEQYRVPHNTKLLIQQPPNNYYRQYEENNNYRSHEVKSHQIHELHPHKHQIIKKQQNQDSSFSSYKVNERRSENYVNQQQQGYIALGSPPPRKAQVNVVTYTKTPEEGRTHSKSYNYETHPPFQFYNQEQKNITNQSREKPFFYRDKIKITLKNLHAKRDVKDQVSHPSDAEANECYPFLDHKYHQKRP